MKSKRTVIYSSEDYAYGTSPIFFLKYAIDISAEGQKKALKLAKKEKVKINYEIGNLFDLDIIDEQYDCAALIYAHFPPSILSDYHKEIAKLVKPTGYIILEGFSTGHLELRK
jgi:2-polyprenyl-3-methyl-5-hydroxy-6-metoxy-1,4-benzoquinol methylase